MEPDLSNLNTDTATLIRKHLLGTASPEDHAALAQWISADPANQQLFIKVGLHFKKDLELKDLCDNKKKPGRSLRLRSFLKELFT